MSTTNFGQAVWERVKSCNQGGVYPEVLEISQPFIELLPDILEDMLDQKVTFQSLMEAKLAYYRFVSQNYYPKLLADSLTQDSLKCLESTRQEVEEEATTQLQVIIERLTKVTSGVYSPFNGSLVSEAIIMQSAQIGFKQEMAYLYRHDMLTIRLLLELQPEAIVDDTIIAELS